MDVRIEEARHFTFPLIYKGGRLFDEYPVLPFLIAPYGSIQDTFIVGPEEMTSMQNAFIEEVYSRFEGVELASPRAHFFTLQSKLCAAIQIPTDEVDDAGRSGLVVSVGVFASTNGRCSGLSLLSYLRAYFDFYKYYFRKDLLGEGAGQLVRELKSADCWKDICSQLRGVTHALLNVSSLSRQFIRTNIIRTRLRSVGRFLMRRSGKIPNLVVYPKEVDFLEALESLMIDKFDFLIDERRIVNSASKCDVWLIQESPLFELLSKATKIEMRNSHASPLLYIYE